MLFFLNRRILRASLEPVSRQKYVQKVLNQADQIEVGPCGNFSEQYRCICNYLNCHVREEVQWVSVVVVVVAAIVADVLDVADDLDVADVADI